MKTFERIYNLVTKIPKGKVMSYEQVAKLVKISSPRIVGFALHVNKNPEKIPCHRVIKNDGTLAEGYVFGGSKKQKEKLKKEGVCFLNKKTVDLTKSFYKPSRLLILYLNLFFEYGEPGEWPWYGNDKPHTQDEIAIGSILTQNTNWRNVQKVIENLREEKANSILDIYKLGQSNYELLKNLIRPSGFYNQKAERIFLFCKFIVEEYGNMEKLSKFHTDKIHSDLLSLKGIGKETADTILLYALCKLIFVIDNYTKRFVQKYNLTKSIDYDSLQRYFTDNLPKNVKLYQNYHALIVKAMKEIKK